MNLLYKVATLVFKGSASDYFYRRRAPRFKEDFETFSSFASIEEIRPAVIAVEGLHRYSVEGEGRRELFTDFRKPKTVPELLSRNLKSFLISFILFVFL